MAKIPVSHYTEDVRRIQGLPLRIQRQILKDQNRHIEINTSGEDGVPPIRDLVEAQDDFEGDTGIWDFTKRKLGRGIVKAAPPRVEVQEGGIEEK